MGVSVIAGDFIARARVSEGIKLNSTVGNADEGARLARMVHELKESEANATVYGLRLTEFDNRNPLGAFSAPACFPYGDALAGKLAQIALALQ